ncbi:FUSC family protein, partial [Staphylococcus aureus]|uniref:FUSC family protein n=1 Tax=Staphylococcus aureus TaxID=1280 RepID=UPI00338E7CC5
LIVALFAQSYVLSAVGLAIWVAICSFGASLLRNNLSYGFAIGGIIAAMVVALSHSTTTPPFEIAVMRTLESLLAATVVAVVNVLFSPPIGLRNYLNTRLALLRSLGAELKRVAAFFEPAGA